MLKSEQLPNCIYQKQPLIICPACPTPNETLYLSNLDDQKFLRFTIKYLYIFRKSVDRETLKSALSRALVQFYPLAGRLRRRVEDDDHKLEVDCNGEGAVFAEALMDLSCDEFFEFAMKPNRSLLRKLLYRVEAPHFFDLPPLVIQVTSLRCGGMILCIAINHCICDGIGSSQFLHAWAHIYQSTPNSNHLSISPFHSRHLLKPRSPPQVTFSHSGFTKIAPTAELNPQTGPNIFNFLQSQPLVPSSITFSPSKIRQLKRHCYPSLKCTTFEVLASHTWRSWVKSLGLAPSFQVKLLFSANIRDKMRPEMPRGYYGNGFVLACAEAKVKELVALNLHHGVKLVQHAKSTITNEYVRSMIDLLDDGNVTTDLSSSLVISQWSKLGLEELNFGEGKPLHMGPLYSDIYCLFLPVAGEFDAVKVLVSMPESVVDKFEFYMTQLDDEINVENNGDAKNHYEVDNLKMVSV
ncbi:HXXXD-type acyl-transferase family protein [Perilla frutescens var. hirtella]|uniref:HXXXD-type acyl-transferase family protein n=1 Tax=Perilla frutescens var. hirtella TaxID=608512 RepID=A0AAD4NXM3_PERFH|nr:HXXXD-type acyl-transferase family protein [Perilla frutescens var. hirtella]